ncbi:hypothetical protein GGF44_002662, partial [Coemansia sp. RSA 1694]
GEVIDDVLVRHFAGEFTRANGVDVMGNARAVRKLRQAVEGTKRTLSSATTAPCAVESLADGIDFNSSVNRTRFDILCARTYAPLLETIEKVVGDAGYALSQVDQVLLCGGAARVRKLQSRVASLFPESTAVRDDAAEELDEVIAAGCAEQAALIAQGVADPSVQAAADLKVDVLAHAVGLQIDADGLAPVLRKDTPLPASRSVRVALPKGETRAYIAVSEGEPVPPKPESEDDDEEAEAEEEEDVEEDAAPLYRPTRLLAEMVLELDAADEDTRVEVTFFVGTDKKLTVTAAEPVSGRTVTAVIPHREWSDDDSGAVDDGLSLRKMNIFIDIADSPSPEELARRVAKLFNPVFEPVPAIEPEHVRVYRLNGAMTNCVYMVTVTPAPHVPASAAVTSVLRSSSMVGISGAERVQLPVKYLLRVYGTGVDEFLSREKELYWLSQLTSLGFGPRLYGIFGNGRLEEFLESTTLTKVDIRDQSTSKHIARRMCELHSLVSYYRPFGGPNTRAVDLSGAPELWSNVASWLRLVEKKWARIRAVCAANPQCTEILDNWVLVEQSVAKLRQIIGCTNSPVVFAHDDLQYGNILRLEKTGELVVVDFEYAGYNYRGFDIANHFCEWMADYHHAEHPHVLVEDAYPTLEQRKGFLRTYVKAKAFLDANMKADKGIM